MFRARRGSLPSGEASRTFHLHRLTRGRSCPDPAHLMRMRSRGKCRGSNIPFLHTCKTATYVGKRFFFLPFFIQSGSSWTGINLQVLKSGFRQHYEKKISATVDAVLCLRLPPLKLSNWICARRGSGWNEWVTAGSTPALLIPVAPKPQRRRREGGAKVPLQQRGQCRGIAETQIRSTISDRMAVTSTLSGKAVRVSMPRLPPTALPCNEVSVANWQKTRLSSNWLLFNELFLIRL